MTRKAKHQAEDDAEDFGETVDGTTGRALAPIRIRLPLSSIDAIQREQTVIYRATKLWSKDPNAKGAINPSDGMRMVMMLAEIRKTAADAELAAQLAAVRALYAEHGMVAALTHESAGVIPAAATTPAEASATHPTAED